MRFIPTVFFATLTIVGHSQMAFSQQPISKGDWSYKNGKPESVTFDYGTELTAKEVDRLSNCTSLTQIVMGYAGIDSEYVEIEGDLLKLGRLKNLQDVHLNKDGINDDDLKFVTLLPKIHTLEFNADNGYDGAPICTDRCADYLSSAKTLRSLVIHDGQFTDKFVANITKGLPDLEELSLNSAELTDESLRLLSERCKKLKSLSIASDHFTAKGLKHLDKLKNLKKRRVSSTSLREINNPKDVLKFLGTREKVSVTYEGDGPVVPKTQKVSADLQKLTHGELIDLLVHKKESRAALSQYSADSIPVDTYSNRPTGVLKPETPKAYAVLAELIRRGGNALPDLADRVTDKNNTEFVFGGKDIDGQRAYRLRVGDLCFEVIGKIVDQPMKAVTYTGGKVSWRVVTSPVDTPELAKTVQKDWGKVSEEKYKAYLIDRSSKFVRWSAWHKLRFYYPESTEEIAIQLLRRPTFDKSHLLSFIKTDLVAEDDPTNWQVKIDDYLHQNEDHLSLQIPYWIHKYYGETGLAPSETFLARQKNAKAILKKLYPDFEPTRQARSEAAEINDHISAVSSLGNIPSKKIDTEVFKMLRDTLKTKVSEKERYKLTWLTEACLKRLYGQNYHANGRSNALFHLCNGILEKENSMNPIYERNHSYNHILQQVVLSFLVRYEPKKSHRLFLGFQSSDTTKTLSQKLKMLSGPATVEPWMLDFLKEQLNNKKPIKEIGLGRQHSVRFCDRAAQIIAHSYLEKPVRLELEANPKRMDDQIAKLKRALAGEKDIEFGPPGNQN